MQNTAIQFKQLLSKCDIARRGVLSLSTQFQQLLSPAGRALCPASGSQYLGGFGAGAKRGRFIWLDELIIW